MTKDEMIERILGIKALMAKIDSDFEVWKQKAIVLDVVDLDLLKKCIFDKNDSVNKIKEILKQKLDKYRITLCEKEDR